MVDINKIIRKQINPVDKILGKDKIMRQYSIKKSMKYKRQHIYYKKDEDGQEGWFIKFTNDDIDGAYLELEEAKEVVDDALKILDDL